MSPKLIVGCVRLAHELRQEQIAFAGSLVAVRAVLVGVYKLVNSDM